MPPENYTPFPNTRQLVESLYTSAISSINTLDSKPFPLLPVSLPIPLSSSWNLDSEMAPFSLANFKAIIVSTVIWVVNAFVEATPISGPHGYRLLHGFPGQLRNLPHYKLQIQKPLFPWPSLWLPRYLQFPRIVKSAISTSLSVITGFRYRNSEAYSTSTGILAKSSKIYSATRPACQDVPQATIIILFAFRNFSRF